MMNERVADFHRLQQRLRLTGILTTRTALRIGTGDVGEWDAVDLPVIKNAVGLPFLPGSSLKGALRSTLEALVRGAQRPEVDLWACDPLAEDDTDAAKKACGLVKSEHKKDQQQKPENHCAVCRLFGSAVVASHVRFCDSLVRLSEQDRKNQIIPVEIRDSVAIDRDLKTVYKSHNYNFEVVSPGTEFDVEVFVENPKPWLMGLLMIGFDQISEGFTAIGGFTSRGLGRVHIQWSSMTKVTAKDLFEGQPGQTFESDTLTAEFNLWRQALAERLQGSR